MLYETFARYNEWSPLTSSEQPMPTNKNIEYQSIQTLKGVGPSIAKKLERLEIHTIQDVMFHLPLRYEDRTKLTLIIDAQSGDQVLIEGMIEHSEIKYGGRGRRSLLCLLTDNTATILLRFFYFNKSQQVQLSVGTKLRCFGTVRYGAMQTEIIHPEYKVVVANQKITEQQLTAIYPKTDGVHQSLLKKISTQVLEKIKQDELSDYLPEDLVKKHQFPNLKTALLEVHQPNKNTNINSLNHYQTKAQQRLLFEELLAHQLSLLQVRYQTKKLQSYALCMTDEVANKFSQQFGFKLTNAQTKVIAEIRNDMKKNQPMLRLVQGDVGSGKTAVAGVAAKICVENCCQVSIMAPTEILAQQHYQNFSQWFKKENCVLITGKDKGKVREKKLEKINSGESLVVIGTHALFQQDVHFKNLAFLIVDEQHRFGVHQRLALRQKGKNKSFMPHQLIMTATPIPRSLAMTAYADLDYSVIDELPAGRKAVTTVVVPSTRRAQVIDRVAKACEKGGQAYWVCTLIEESEILQCESAQETAEKLSAELQNLNIVLLHGRMKQDDKNEIIERFKNKEIDILVATTVIEVGVDVPGASLMIIENAERLGLAQLHQLRGRVGRGKKQSTCVLMYQSPLSQTGKQRLAVLRETNDGFVVAEQDLQLRGPGEVLGVKQTGLMQLKIADIVRDEIWFDEVKKVANQLIKDHPHCVQPLVRRWLGKGEQFANV